MKYKLLLNCLLTTTLVVFALTISQAQNLKQPKSISSGEDVVLQWHRVLQETIRTPGQQPPTIFPVRSLAMMHAAMFDAVNSIDGSYTSYLTDVSGTKHASLEAAAAQAAHDVLTALFPTRQAVFEMERDALVCRLHGDGERRRAESRLWRDSFHV